MLTDRILTLILFVPTVGALVVALLPRRGRVIQIFTLLVTLLTFALTLHLPVHFTYAQPGFQFEENDAWIATPTIRYHLGVDGLSLWLMVLTGFLAPLGVLVSWHAIDTRTKVFYFFFLLQQTAMIGIFVSLDMFLYYGFWELSLVPMAILIAMFGRDRGRRGGHQILLYAFIPSALLLVAILWLYAKTGTFDFVQLQAMLASGSLGALPRRARLGLARLSCRLCRQSPGLPAARLAGRRDSGSAHRHGHGARRQARPLLDPALQPRPLSLPSPATLRPSMIALAVIGILYGALLALVQNDLKRLAAFSTLGTSQLLHPRHLLLHGRRPRRRHLPDSERGHHRRRALHAARLPLRALRHLRHVALRRPGGNAALVVTLFVITALAAGRAAHAQRLRRRVPHPLRQLPRAHRRWVGVATPGVILSAAYMLWMIQRVFYGSPRHAGDRSASALDLDCARAPRALADGRPLAGHGRRLPLWITRHRRRDDRAWRNPASVTASSAGAPRPALRAAMPAAAGTANAMNALSHSARIVLTLTGVLVMLDRAADAAGREPQAPRLAGHAGRLRRPCGQPLAIFDCPRARAFYGIVQDRRLQRLLPSADRRHRAGHPADLARLFEDTTEGHGEYFALVLFGAIGMMFMTCSVELLMVFIGARNFLHLHLHPGGLPQKRASASESAAQVLPAGLLRHGLLPLRHRPHLRRHGIHQHRFLASMRLASQTPLAALPRPWP